MAAIHKSIDPILAECGLTVMQFPVNPVEGHGVGIRTLVVHESGQTIEGDLFLPTMKDDPQAAGSTITYARRYAISGILGLVTDEDDDAEDATAARAAVAKPTERKPARAKSRTSPAMNAASRDQLKHAVDARIMAVGTPDDTQESLLMGIAKSLGYASPIELKDGELTEALAWVAAWKSQTAGEKA